jgi:hypothetical protein
MAITARFKILLAVAAAVVAYIVYTTGDDAKPGAAPSVRQAQQAVPRNAGIGAATAHVASGRNVSSAGSEESARMYAQLSHRVSDGSSAGALFKATSWYTPPPPPPPAPPVAEAPPPPPTAPPLPFTVMGSFSRPGERATYFLTRGDRVFDVHVGDTIDNIYSVDREADGQLQLTYKPLGIQQFLPVGGS